MDSVDELAEQVAASAPSDSPLDRLSTAVLVGGELRDRADQLIDRYVGQARDAGHSWSEIGAALGVTKQAAQQRFVAPWPTDFDPGARALVPTAERHARSFRHRYVGTEHLLLALTGDDGLAGTALQRCGVESAEVRRRILDIVGEGHSGATGSLGVTPRTKRVLESAVKEARRLGHRCGAAPEHVMLALGSARGGVAVQILHDLGVDEDRLRHELSELLAREAPELAANILRRPRRLSRAQR